MVLAFPEELRGRWVAYRIEGGEVVVIGTGDGLEELLGELRRRGIDPRFVLVDYVPDEDVELLLSGHTAAITWTM